MFQAPIDLAFPDLTLPATNDCWYHIGLTGEVGHGIPNAEGFYELAYGWFRDPMFAWVVRQNWLAGDGRQRSTLEGLLDGAMELPMIKRGESPPRHLDGSGFAMLRAGSGPEALAVLLKASLDDGDSHGHPDQLGIAAFGAGARNAIDPGTPGYGIPLNDTWYRQTASHSTALLDARSQPPGAARITHWEATDDAVIVEAEIRWPQRADWPALVRRAVEIGAPDRDPYDGYAGVVMRRRLELREGRLHDRFTIGAPEERTIDLVTQLPADIAPDPDLGAVATPPPAPATLLAGCGYEHLTGTRDVTSVDAFSAALPNGRLTVATLGSKAELRLLASAPGNPATDRHNVLIRRRTGMSVAFESTWTWDFSGAPWRSSSSSSG
jgi:hypothetical protein